MRNNLGGGIDGAFYPVSIFPQGGRDPKTGDEVVVAGD